MDKLLDVKIASPRDILYTGKALSVSSKNSSGDFDILAEHANFITIVENQPIIIIDANSQRQVFNFSQAIIFTTLNSVSIFAEPQTATLE